MTFKRITVRPDQMDGAPYIRDLRISVATVVRMVADGMSPEEILAAFPDLEAEDIREAIHYAAESFPEREPSLASFRERLRASIERNDEILDRLAR